MPRLRRGRMAAAQALFSRATRKAGPMPIAGRPAIYDCSAR